MRLAIAISSVLLLATGTASATPFGIEPIYGARTDYPKLYIWAGLSDCVQKSDFTVTARKKKGRVELLLVRNHPGQCLGIYTGPRELEYSLSDMDIAPGQPIVLLNPLIGELRPPPAP